MSAKVKTYSCRTVQALIGGSAPGPTGNMLLPHLFHVKLNGQSEVRQRNNHHQTMVLKALFFESVCLIMLDQKSIIYHFESLGMRFCVSSYLAYES
jgi:hypothetical protein